MPSNYISKFELKPDTWVFIPSKSAITYGKSVKRELESLWSPPNYYFHLKSGGHVLALKSHQDSKYFLHLDIKNFFGSISGTRVTRVLKQYFSYQKSREIAIESTTKHPVTKSFILPFGFVQSPILASLCLESSAVGKYLDKISKSKDCIVSVYVDDIIISSTELETLERIRQEIDLIVVKSGFEWNTSKVEGPADNITAFNIELSHKQLLITPERLQKLADRLEQTTNENIKNGINGYIASVNPQQLT